MPTLAKSIDFPSAMSTCPFCRIIADQSHPSIVLQNALAAAFLDIRPIRPGHVLIVPKRHEADFWTLSKDEQDAIMDLANRLAAAQRELFNPKKVGMFVAGFDVPHAHLHVLPLHEASDVTSESIIRGTLEMASAGELAGLTQRYARHFREQG